MSTTKSTDTKKTPNTNFAEQYLDDERVYFVKKLVEGHMQLLAVMIRLWAMMDPPPKGLPSSDKIAKTLTERLEAHLRTCPAEYRTLLAAEVLFYVFRDCTANEDMVGFKRHRVGSL